MSGLGLRPVRHPTQSSICSVSRQLTPSLRPNRSIMSLHIHHTDTDRRLQTASLYSPTPFLSVPASLISQTISPLIVSQPVRCQCEIISNSNNARVYLDRPTTCEVRARLAGSRWGRKTSRTARWEAVLIFLVQFSWPKPRVDRDKTKAAPRIPRARPLHPTSACTSSPTAVSRPGSSAG